MERIKPTEKKGAFLFFGVISAPTPLKKHPPKHPNPEGVAETDTRRHRHHPPGTHTDTHKITPIID